jgi:hypothetical protein
MAGKFTIAPDRRREGILDARSCVFLHLAVWNEAARTATVDSGMLYTTSTALSGAIARLKAETWW